MGEIFETLADVFFAMTGATPTAAKRSGRWWRRRALEFAIVVTVALACAVAWRLHD